MDKYSRKSSIYFNPNLSTYGISIFDVRLILHEAITNNRNPQKWWAEEYNIIKNDKGS